MYLKHILTYSDTRVIYSTDLDRVDRNGGEPRDAR